MQFFDPDTYQFSFHSRAVLSVGMGVLFLGTFVAVREWGARIGMRFWALHAAISVWFLAYGLAFASRQEAWAYRSFLIGTAAVVFIPAALIGVTATVVRREQELNGLFRLSTGLSGLFCWFLFGTDRFITGLRHYAWGAYPLYGILGVLFIVYFGLIGILSLVLFSRAYRVSTYRRNRKRFVLVLGVFGLGYTASLDFAANLGIPLYPVGYLSFAVYLVLMAWVVLRYRLVDITPELASGRILETMKGAVIVSDLEGAVRVANRSAEEMLGFQKDDLVGRDLLAALGLPEGTRIGSGEMIWRAGGGKALEVSVQASPLRDERDGALLGTVYVAQDITERKEAEAQLRRTARELQEANRKLETLDRLKSDFVSTVSHELRTPLTSIKAFAEILLVKPALSAERKERLLRIINDESDRLRRLINDLLDLARIEAGTQTWRKAPVDLNKVIETSLDGMIPLLHQKELSLETAVEPSLPQVMADQDRLVQVMTNLLSNAVKFTAPGGTISVRAGREMHPDPRIVVAVSDTGSGIPEEEVGQIFEKFHRASDNLTGLIEGTGLGLTIARQIVEHHGGRIWVTSVRGKGSTFSFSMPVQNTDD